MSSWQARSIRMGEKCRFDDDHPRRAKHVANLGNNVGPRKALQGLQGSDKWLQQANLMTSRKQGGRGRSASRWSDWRRVCSSPIAKPGKRSGFSKAVSARETYTNAGQIGWSATMGFAMTPEHEASNVYFWMGKSGGINLRQVRDYELWGY
ncbi:hypothetical protein BD779DRAFT_430218 [Infundibulicybe gibba]|nr:hypothetical protein BD779DRAFT_430218 [Infundibulicybe gibba]